MDYFSGKMQIGASQVEKYEEYQQQKEYRERMRMIRHEVMDYYGSAIHFFPAARADYERVKSLDDESLLAEARKLGII